LVSVAYNEEHTRAHSTRGWCAPVFWLRKCASLLFSPPSPPIHPLFRQKSREEIGGQHKRKWRNKNKRRWERESVNGMPFSTIQKTKTENCNQVDITCDVQHCRNNSEPVVINWATQWHSATGESERLNYRMRLCVGFYTEKQAQNKSRESE
jgi:hypothetical protein